MNMPIYVLTNDKHLWLIPGFCYLFNLFWSAKQSATIVGYTPPETALPDNFSFHSIASENYPVDSWSDGLLRFLDQITAPYFILFLEDYWLTSPVDIATVATLCEFIRVDERILRIDLTGDRASKRRVLPYTTYKGCSIIRSLPTAKYQMSFQAAVWSTTQLRNILRAGESPWQSEIYGTKRLSTQEDVLVLGSTSVSINYKPVYRTHKARFTLPDIPKQHLEIMRSKGYI